MSEERKMPLLSHMKELRKRLFVVLAVFAVSMIGAMTAAPRLLQYLKSVPPASGMTWNAFSPGDGLRLYVAIAMVVASAVTLPALLHQLWLFVRHGLRKREQAAALRYIPLSLICFAAGTAFGYRVVFPLSFSFVSSVAERMNLVETYGVSQYFGFMFSIVIPVSVTFELPVIVMFLTSVGLLTPARLKRMRRYAYLVLVVAASAVTPPDFLSAFLVLIPLAALYECSVWLSSVIHRRKTAQAAAISLQPHG